MVPLNGTKTHPLSPHARGKLLEISGRPMPPQEVNPGVVNRLLREKLVETVDMPSPYKKDRGRDIPHLAITAAGLSALAATRQTPRAGYLGGIARRTSMTAEYKQLLDTLGASTQEEAMAEIGRLHAAALALDAAALAIKPITPTAPP